MKLPIVIICSALFTAILFSCSDQIAGNSSEITNGYCCAFSAPADSAMVVAYPKGYVPFPASAGPETTFTDKNGRFSMSLGRKAWNLVVYDKLQAHGAFVPLPGGDSTLDTIALTPLGAIHGLVNDTTALDRCVGVVGSPFYARITGKSDTFSLIKMPAFNYGINLWQLETGINKAGPPGETITDARSTSVMILPDSTANVVINH
jgi:hypothetical protein